jgi:dihydroorotate dehydrogenase
MGIYTTLRPLLFRLPPETAHALTLKALALAGRILPQRTPDDHILACTVMGKNFSNPIGLAAGFDKNGEVMGGVLKLGFGFTEIGTLTPVPQQGNPQPRVFRLPAQEAVINRLGFNNLGHVAAYHKLSLFRARMARRGESALIGVNIGANKTAEDRISDYEKGAVRFAQLADYLTVNISSPNTPGLRDLQALPHVTEIVARVRAAAPDTPLLIKIAPDLDMDEALAIAEMALAKNVDGLIVSNTTIDHQAVLGARHGDEEGGLSGQPLFAASTAMLSEIYPLTRGKLALVGVGGIATPEHAYAKICAGADLVQLYTGLIYNGPWVIGKLRRGLAELLRRDGFENVAAATGSDHR